jgi:hypothetical protein
LGYHVLELLLLVLKAVLLLDIALIAGVVLVIVIVLVLVGGGAELLSFGAIDDEVSGVAALKTTSR